MRRGLGTAAEQGWTPETIAEYFVESMQNGDYRGKSGQSIRTVVRGFFQQDEESYDTDRLQLGAVLSGQAETYDWDTLEHELAEYLAGELEDLDTAENHPELGPAYVSEDATRETIEYREAGPYLDDGDPAEQDTLYIPTFRHIDGIKPPQDREAVWMTTIHSAYDLDRSDEVHLTAIEYMEEDEARETVQKMLAEDQLTEVVGMIEKSIRHGHHDQMRGFTEELVAAGEYENALYILEYAEDNQYSDEAEQLKEIVERPE